MDRALRHCFQFKARRYLVDLLTSGYPRRLITAALAIVTGLLTWSILLHRPVNAVAVQGLAEQQTQTDPETLTQQIVTAHLFGQDAHDTAVTAAVNPANISIQGLIYSDDKDSALAILTVDGSTAFFRIGDKLADGETLLAIAPSAVELGNNGVTRVVELQQDFGNGAGIGLAGDTGLIGPRRPSFPGAAGAGAAYAPALRPVSISSNADPLAQLQSLRQQLIPQRPAAATPPPIKHSKKP